MLQAAELFNGPGFPCAFCLSPNDVTTLSLINKKLVNVVTQQTLMHCKEQK
jgi:hypothetical protein